MRCVTHPKPMLKMCLSQQHRQRLFRKLHFPLFMAFACWCRAQAPEVLHHWWRTDDNVNAIALDAAHGKVYIGGGFHYVGPPQNYVSALEVTDGATVGNIAHPNRRVLCSAPDGQGGWFIGGDFTEVGGLQRTRLAHLNAQGQVTSWAPTATDAVTKMSREGNTVYVAGEFGALNATSRNKFGALDATTGTVLAWDPFISSATYSLTCITAYNGAVYIAGFYDNMNGEPRNNLSAVDGVTGETLPWDPDPVGWVSCMQGLDNTVLVSGNFSQIGGQARQNIAALDAVTGVPTAWAPSVVGPAYTMLISDGTVYLAGAITQAGGQPRASFAQVDLTTGEATDWAPRVTSGNTANTLFRSGNTIYLGGGFTSIDGQDRLRLAAVDAITGALNPWAPGANETVTELGPMGDHIFAAGQFTSTGGVPRKGLAALDLTTGAATDWAPQLPFYSTVYALAVRDDIVHVGGVFDSLGLVPRRNIGAVDGTTGEVTPWAPEANNAVLRLVLHDQRSYASGMFDSIGGQEQANVAALDLMNGQSTGWAPDVNGPVYAFAFSGDTVFLGGSFSTVNGETHNRLVAVNASTGEAWTWDHEFPTLNTSINALLLHNEVLYIAGIYNDIGGLDRGGLAAVDRSTGDLLEWDPSASGQGFCLAYSNGTVIAGGDFVPYETQPQHRQLAAIDATSGMISDWSMVLGSRVSVMDGNEQVTCIGGMTTPSSIDGEPVRYFAALGLPIINGMQPNTDSAIAPLIITPNPTTGVLHLDSRSPQHSKLTVMDARGVVVMRTAYTASLDVAHLPSGVYTVVTEDEVGTRTGRTKVVKQ